MTRIDMVDDAMRTLGGNASADEVAALVEERYGEKIEPKFMPFFIASIRDRMHLVAQRRERAGAAVAES